MATARPRSGSGSSSSSSEYGPAPPTAADLKKYKPLEGRGLTNPKDIKKAEDLGYVLSGARRMRAKAAAAAAAEPTAADRRKKMEDSLVKRLERENQVVEDFRKLMEEQQKKRFEESKRLRFDPA